MHEPIDSRQRHGLIGEESIFRLRPCAVRLRRSVRHPPRDQRCSRSQDRNSGRSECHPRCCHGRADNPIWSLDLSQDRRLYGGMQKGRSIRPSCSRDRSGGSEVHAAHSAHTSTGTEDRWHRERHSSSRKSQDSDYSHRIAQAARSAASQGNCREFRARPHPVSSAKMGAFDRH